MVRPIKFGTSGWRGILADEFTFDRCRVLVAAIATHLTEIGEARQGVVVAHDPRFMAEQFTAAAAEELASRGIDVLVCDRPTPTPAVAHIVLERRLGAAINFTASHNPPIYQGLKLSPSWGGPALPETTSRIEELAARYLSEGIPAAGISRGAVRSIDPVEGYLAALGRHVDGALIARSGLRIAYDAIHGAGAGFLDRFLTEAGCRVEVLNAKRDVMFGGAAPEPSESRLTELSRICRRDGALGLSTDGDADRFGIVGQGGEYILPNEVLALVAHYLIAERGVSGDLARSVATTALLDRVAAANGRVCRETPVGFKYIGEMISRGELAMGGEESAGMSIRGHVPEKDGILACLLVAEMCARSGKTLAQRKADLDRIYGPLYSRRANLELTGDLPERLRKVLGNPPLEVGGLRADRLQQVDGTKWIYGNGDWALLRLSGTEPVARLYLESPDAGRLERLEASFRRWIGVPSGGGGR